MRLYETMAIRKAPEKVTQKAPGKVEQKASQEITQVVHEHPIEVIQKAPCACMLCGQRILTQFCLAHFLNKALENLKSTTTR